MKKLAESLADKLSGDLSEEQMKAVMEDHERQVAQLEGMLASEKEKQMAALRDKLRRRREEREAALLRKQKEEVHNTYQLQKKKNEYLLKIFNHFQQTSLNS